MYANWIVWLQHVELGNTVAYLARHIVLSHQKGERIWSFVLANMAIIAALIDA